MHWVREYYPKSRSQAIARAFVVELILVQFVRKQSAPFLFGRTFKVVGKAKDCLNVLRNSRVAKLCNTNLRVGQSVLLDTRTHEVVSKNVLLLVLSIAFVCFFIGWLWYAF